MTTHLYVLTKPEHNVVEQYHTIWGGSRVPVPDGDWYAARARCFHHAQEAGHEKIIMVVGTVKLFHRAYWSGKGECTHPVRADEYTQHGLWLYLDRLLQRYGHVYVPPLSSCWAWQVRAKKQWNYWCSPTIPMVAAYQVDAVAELHDRTIPWGDQLCAAGYDSFTIDDYFFHNLGDTVYDERGSATTWRIAYERAINRFI